MKFNLNFRSHLSEDEGLKLPKKLQSVPGSFTLWNHATDLSNYLSCLCPCSDIQHNGLQLLDIESFNIMLTLKVIAVLMSAVKNLPSYKNKHDNKFRSDVIVWNFL